MLDRIPRPLQRFLYAGGTRADRLRDPDAVVAALGLSPGMIVADLVTTATSHCVWRGRSSRDGVAYALDASTSTLDDLRRAADERDIANLRPIRVASDRLEIPEPVDLLFVSATYHHLRDRVTYFAAARAFIRPAGRVTILEARRVGPLARWQGHHATHPDRVRDEMGRAGYRVIAEQDLVRGYLFATFEVSRSGPRGRPR